MDSEQPFNLFYFVQYTPAFLTLGTTLLDDQLMNTCLTVNISLELKKPIWLQLAFLNVFFLLLPEAPAKLMRALGTCLLISISLSSFLLLNVSGLIKIVYINQALICQVFVSHFIC